jgi:hypothetical protein
MLDPWHWFSKSIVHNLVDGGYYHTTEDEDLRGPFTTKELAEKEQRIYNAWLDGGEEAEEMQRYVEDNP